MTAALWAVASGVGFGLFQSLNRRALVDIEDPYVSTFINLVIATLALLGVALATEDVGRLLDAGAWPLIAFAAAGIMHFLLGWTFLNLSQRRIGAARTSPLLTMTPVFALAVAAIAVGQLPGLGALAAIVSSARAAMTRLRKVETYGSSMSTSARRLKLWKSPNPTPEATAQSAAVTRTSWSLGRRP